MTVPAIILTVVLAVLGMELFAWWAHKYIMHGWGWGWHRDHHEPHDHVFEKNDLYAVTFGTIVFFLFLIGYLYSELLWWVALGITLYGLIYTVVHDGLVHRQGGRCELRLRLRRRPGQAQGRAQAPARGGHRRGPRQRGRLRSGTGEVHAFGWHKSGFERRDFGRIVLVRSGLREVG